MSCRHEKEDLEVNANWIKSAAGACTIKLFTAVIYCVPK